MADQSERKPLSADYIHKVHEDAKRAVSDVAYRRRWGDTKSGSPVSTLALCEEIARLNIALGDDPAQTRDEPSEVTVRRMRTEDWPDRQ